MSDRMQREDGATAVVREPFNTQAEAPPDVPRLRGNSLFADLCPVLVRALEMPGHQFCRALAVARLHRQRDLAVLRGILGLPRRILAAATQQMAADVDGPERFQDARKLGICARAQAGDGTRGSGRGPHAGFRLLLGLDDASSAFDVGGRPPLAPSAAQSRGSSTVRTPGAGRRLRAGTARRRTRGSSRTRRASPPASLCSASRTVVREIPNASASSPCPRRAPGSSSPSSIMVRIRSYARSTTESALIRLICIATMSSIANGTNLDIRRSII